MDGWAAIVNFRNARLSHVLFSDLLCVFHTPICFWFPVAPPPHETTVFFSVYYLFAAPVCPCVPCL